MRKISKQQSLQSYVALKGYFFKSLRRPANISVSQSSKDIFIIIYGHVSITRIAAQMKRYPCSQKQRKILKSLKVQQLTVLLQGNVSQFICNNSAPAGNVVPVDVVKALHRFQKGFKNTPLLYWGKIPPAKVLQLCLLQF